ncbi:hypothetical protein L596_020446 [Steinernema carpocapsae]|uniref:PH domain-containing protein n=1 Tax=Steinernema carpocapsae TaxID=34508 RepID=A0A4V6A0W4_STECR|nr:hypothetical protein L596_020446 [Steinernema carpocapsae]
MMNMLKKSSSIELRSSRTSLSSRCSPQAGTSLLTSRTIEEESERSEEEVQYEGRVHAYFAPVTKFNKNKPSYAVLRTRRLLEIYESEKARVKAKQEYENPSASGKRDKHKKAPEMIDLEKCFNVSQHQYNKEMDCFNCIALMTPDQTLFLKSDPEDSEQTDRWFQELLQAMKTARALKLGRHVNDKEFFERSFDMQLVKSPKIDKKTLKALNSYDRPKNICEVDESLEGKWRLCFYPHTVILCRHGIEPCRDESRMPATHVPPFDKDDYIELPRSFIIRHAPYGKFYYIKMNVGFPRFGSCELFLATDSSDTTLFIDAEYEQVHRHYQQRQCKGQILQFPSIDCEDEAPSERRTSNSSGRHGHRRHTSGQSGRKMPASSQIAVVSNSSRNTSVPVSSSTVVTAAKAARAIEKSRRHFGGGTPETIRKTSVTRPMSFGIASPLAISAFHQQPRAHSISEQGAPLTPNGQNAKSRKYSHATHQRSEEICSQDHLINKVFSEVSSKRDARLAQTANCPVMMSFSNEGDTEDSGGTLKAYDDGRSPRLRRRGSSPYVETIEVSPETVPRPRFDLRTNLSVHENAAVPILNGMNMYTVPTEDDYEQYDAAENPEKAQNFDKVARWILDKRRSQRPDSTSSTNDEEIASLSSSFAHTNTDCSDVDMSDGGSTEPKESFAAEYTMMEPMDRISCSSGSNTHLSVPMTYDPQHEDVRSYTSECSSDSCYGSVQKRAFSFSHRAGGLSTNGTTGTTSMSSSANHSRQFTDDEQSSPGATVHSRRAHASGSSATRAPVHQEYPINHLGIKDQMRTAVSPNVLLAAAADDDEARTRAFSLGSKKHFWTQPLKPLKKISHHLKGQSGSRQNSSVSSIPGDSSGGCSLNSSNSALHPNKALYGGRRKTTSSGNGQHMEIAEGSSMNSSQASLHSHRTGGSSNSSRSLFRNARAGSAAERGDLIEMEFINENGSDSPRRVSRNPSESFEDMSSPSRSRTSSFGQRVPGHSHSYHHLGSQQKIFETAAQVHHGAEIEDPIGDMVHSPSHQLLRSSQSEIHEQNFRTLQAKLEPAHSFITSEPIAQPRIDTIPAQDAGGLTLAVNNSFASSPHLLMPAASYCSTYSRFGTCCGGGMHFFETIQEAVSGRSSRCDSRCASSLADRSHVLSPPCVINYSPSIILNDDSTSARLSQRRGSANSCSRPTTSVSVAEDSRKSSCSSASSCCRRRSTTSMGGAVGQRRRSSAFEFYAIHGSQKRQSRDSTASAESAGGISCCSCEATMMTTIPSNSELSANQLCVNRPPTPDVLPRHRSKSAVITSNARSTPSIKLDSPL